MRPAARCSVLFALLLAACAPTVAELPKAPVAYGAAITVDAQPVPMDTRDPASGRIGNFTYAGGVALTSTQTSRLHGMSDLKVWPDGRLLAQGDQGDQLEGRLVLDAAGRLAGVADARLTALKDERGADLYAGGQREFDTEGVAELASGDRLVSLEQHDRMFLYPRDGGLPRPAPFPQIAYVHNQGMEALAAAPAVAPDAYLVGIETSGQTFLCRLAAGCERGRDIPLEGFELSGFDLMPGGGMAYLLRDYSIARGNVVRLRVADARGEVLDGLELAAPLTVDNFEGIAAVPRPGGSVRFYIIADDNFGTYNGKPTNQRTLLLAFDWTPQKGRGP